jgi:hypothetical protein
MLYKLQKDSYDTCEKKIITYSWNGTKYPCKYNDPVTYISVPLGPKNSNIFIPYLSAIMIYKQTSKSIFYLLHNKEYTDVQTYCDDINIPIMHIATCAGDNCYRNIKNQFNT